MTFPWLFEDEASPEADGLLDLVTEHGAVVPSLWYLECANGLAMAERRGRIDGEGIARAIGLLHRLPLEVDDAAPSHALDSVLTLARTHGLTAYDPHREEVFVGTPRGERPNGKLLTMR